MGLLGHLQDQSQVHALSSCQQVPIDAVDVLGKSHGTLLKDRAHGANEEDLPQGHADHQQANNPQSLHQYNQTGDDNQRGCSDHYEIVH